MKKLLLGLLLTSPFAWAQADLGGETLVVGSDTTYPPFEMVNKEGQIVGFDVDVMNAICAQINCVAEFKTTAWDGILAALVNGEFDMVASGVTITPERDKIVDFTDPYHEVTQAIAVRTEDDGLTLDDFKTGDYVLGAQTGTTLATSAEALVGRDRTRLYDTFNTAVQALLNNDVDGVVLDDTSADAFAGEYAGDLAIPIRDVATGDKLGFVVPDGDPLAEDLNEGLAAIKEDGTLDKLVEKWLVVKGD